ncbi:MAG: SGNH/GDSL hydrolase family protein [Candidatus Obscuribacterales bacterium]
MFLLSLGLFAAVNAALVAWQPLQPMAVERIPTKPTWESHRTRDFMAGTQAPDAVLFGSSLMMIPTACRDADYLNVTIDPVVHPYSQYLQAKIAEKTGRQLKCFNFALPGGMISDHYMIVSSLFSNERKPKLAIFGLSLRDFIDSGVECAASTPAYHYFSRYKTESEIDALLPLSMPSIFNRGQYLADRYIYLLGKRLQIQVMAEEAISSAVIKAIDSTDRGGQSKPSLEPSTQVSTKPDSNPDAALSGTEVTEGMVALQPNAFYPWQDNSREYKKRFKSANQSMFKVQTEYFKRMIAQLRSEGVEVLIVNMPLTPANMALMPKGSYEQYMNLMQQTAREPGCTLLNLNDGKTFVASNFKDPVHMNGSGGKILIDKIADCVPDLKAVARPSQVAATNKASVSE